MRTLVQKCTDEAERRLVENADEQSQQTLIANSISEKDIGFTKLTDIASVEMLLELMRGEIYFTEQEKMLQVILQTEPGLILRRYTQTSEVQFLLIQRCFLQQAHLCSMNDQAICIDCRCA